MSSKWLLGILLFLAILGGIYLFNNINTENNTNPQQGITGTQQPTTQPSETVVPPTEQAASPTGAQEISVEGDEFSFAPSTLNLKRGQPVTITFTNTGEYPHDFAIPALNLKTETIPGGQQDTISFTPQATGAFEFDCTVPGHEERGMKGTMIVK